MQQPFVHVDSFSEKPFAGNPAGVCLLSVTKPDAWMQNVAAEMNLAATAFLVRQEDGYGLRWFSPTTELALCGHGTLASTHVLWEEGHRPVHHPISFFTKSGLLTAVREGAWINLDFPSQTETTTDAPDGLAEGLNVTPSYVGKNRLDYLIEVANEAEVRTLQPDFTRLARLDARGFIVTSRSESAEYDFVSRFFAPSAGISEDPVTGSAHCCLGPFWAKRLNKNELTGYQASGRGGVVRVRMKGERVVLSGQAVTVLRGELTEAVR